MKDWLIEIIDQIALGEVLANSSVTCGQRFGLIAEDNAIEFMLIAYVEIYKQLVGGHKPGGIPKKTWDQTKRQFPTLLPFVVSLEPNLQPLEKKISEYHDFRDSLYHSGTPVTTLPNRVIKHSALARQVLSVLFAIQFTPIEWDHVLARVADCFAQGPTTQTIKRQVTYEKSNGIVKFTTATLPTAPEAIALSLQGYTIRTGAPPSRPMLTKSLAMSGYPFSQAVIDVRLCDMRKLGWVQKKELALTSKGRKELAKRFLV